jgi:hypothetical protein
LLNALPPLTEPTNARWRSPCPIKRGKIPTTSLEDATIKTRRRKNVLDFRVAIFALLITVLGFADRVAVAAPSFSHVFIVMEENRSYSEVVGSSAMPYLNMLINNYGLATQYFANGHPSLPNYLWITSGGNDRMTLDKCEKTSGPLNVDNAVRELNAAGV